jgi:hypothetical protein
MKITVFVGALVVLVACGQQSAGNGLPDDFDDLGLVFPVAGRDSMQNANFALDMLRGILLQGDSSRLGAEGMLKRLRDEAARDTSLPTVLIDPWSTSVRITMDLDSVTVLSAGPDRSFGTSDDLEAGYSRPEQ